jgi:hypothetical protein
LAECGGPVEGGLEGGVAAVAVVLLVLAVEGEDEAVG